MTKIGKKFNIPGYRIIRKIGEGGMSVVYLAFQESLKREVALKIMRPIITDESNVVQRFEQEAEIIAKLYHPNIVNIYEFGHVDDEVLFYAMPYLRHGDLSSYAYHGDEALQAMLAAVCDGLAYAHTQGVIHRDIKPENILFDQFGHVQITDFGIALSDGQRRFTKDRKILGSVFYMSPEQAESKHIDARSDVYSLGAILYEILAGEPVFDRESDLSIMLAHLSDPVPRLPTEVAHWQAVIDRCLAKSPSQRYQSMDALKEAIWSVKAHKQATFQKFKWAAAGVILLFFTVLILTFKPATPVSEIRGASTNNTPVLESGHVATVTAVPDASSAPLAAETVETVIQNKLSTAQITALLDSAAQHIANKQLTTPAAANALDDLLLVLSNVPQQAAALELLSKVMANYYQLVYQAVISGRMKQAKQFSEAIAEVRHRTILANENLLTQLETNTELDRSLMVGAIVEQVQIAKNKLDKSRAEQLIGLVDQAIPGQELVNELYASIDGMVQSGQVLEDRLGIKTVVVTPDHKQSRKVFSHGLAVTQSEITVAQFERFAKATGREPKRCKSKLKTNMIFTQRSYLKPGFKVLQNMPIMCVTWQDAIDYASWLSAQTGLSYRLPSEQEWRHLKKISQATISCAQANLAGREFPDKDRIERPYACDDGVTHVATINQFPANDLGLIGMAGNLSEWLAGCESLGKFKAILKPDDRCDNNPVIGHSWLSGVTDDGAVVSINFGEAWTHIGFRLIRELSKEKL